MDHEVFHKPKQWDECHEITQHLFIPISDVSITLYDEGSSWIERKWVWTLERMGKKEDVDLGVFAERNEITPLGGGSKISEEDLPLWIGDSKIRIGGSEENLETWEKIQIWIQMCLTRAYILWAETQKAQHN